MKELISVIITCYNKEKYITECIESVMNQTYNYIEIIIINDGSVDKSTEICKEYVKNDSRIKYFYQENSGVSQARNFGIEKSEGRRLIFLDGDDYIEKDYIYNLVSESKNCELVMCCYTTVRNGNFIQNKLNKEILKGKDNIIKKVADKRYTNFFSVPYLKLFNTDIIKKYNIKFNINMNFGEDFDFILKYLKYVNQMKITDYTGYYNREIKGTLSRREIPNIWNQMKELYYTCQKIYDQSKNAKELDYLYIRLLKLTLLNKTYKEKVKFYEILKIIEKDKNFLKVKLKHFEFLSKDWIIVLLLKVKSYYLLYIIFKIRREE